MALEEDFQKAADHSKQFTRRPTNEELLDLYALFKQATDGDVQGERPGGFDFKAIAKFDAWTARKGKDKEAAMHEYVDRRPPGERIQLVAFLFYQPDLTLGHLPEEESRHAVKVLRLNAGAEFEVTDGKGNYCNARLLTPDARKCPFEIIRQSFTPPRICSIHLAVAPTKNVDRMEWLVEKCVEIGIEKISFIRCKNSERTSLNLQRMDKIAISAMKQSQQAWLPQLTSIMPFDKFVKGCQESQKFIAITDRQNPVHLKSLASSRSTYAVLIGPEGDFSAEEVDDATRAGFQKASLGPSRLRTETAGLAAVMVLNLINQ